MKSTIKQQVSYFLSAFAFIFVLFVGMQIGFAAIGGGQYNGNMTNPSSPTHAMGFLSSDDPLPTKVGSLILKDFNTSAHSYLLGNSTYQNDCISHKAGAEKETCLEATGNGAGYGFFNLLSALDNNTQQMITLANGSASGGKFAVTPYSNKNPFPDADFVEEQFNDGNDSMLISSLAMKDANGNFAPSDPNHLRPVCVDAQGMLTTDCGAGATVSYSCSGTIVNGQMCSGDDQDLTQNGTWHAVRNCGADKCEYTCDSGYHEENGACVADATYEWKTGLWGSCANTGFCSGNGFTESNTPGSPTFEYCSDHSSSRSNCESFVPHDGSCTWNDTSDYYRTRKVYCVEQGTNNVVSNVNCKPLPRPDDREQCLKVRAYIAKNCNGQSVAQCCSNYNTDSEVGWVDIEFTSDSQDIFAPNFKDNKMSFKYRLHSVTPLGYPDGVPVNVPYTFHPYSYNSETPMTINAGRYAIKSSGAKISTSNGSRAVIQITGNGNGAKLETINFCSSVTNCNDAGGTCPSGETCCRTMPDSDTYACINTQGQGCTEATGGVSQ